MAQLKVGRLDESNYDRGSLTLIQQYSNFKRIKKEKSDELVRNYLTLTYRQIHDAKEIIGSLSLTMKKIATSFKKHTGGCEIERHLDNDTTNHERRAS